MAVIEDPDETLLYWKLVLGFGLIIVGMILVHGYILLNLNSVYSAVTTSLTGDVAAIDNAQRLHEFLSEEETYAQKYLLTGDPVYGRLFREARAQTLPRMDSLATVLRTSRSSGSSGAYGAPRLAPDGSPHAVDALPCAPTRSGTAWELRTTA
jgi:hypothetical protein